MKNCFSTDMCCIFFMAFLFFVLSLSEMLNRIPDRDRKDLEELFNYFVKRTTFSYTLFGDKPVPWLVIFEKLVN